jgi:arylsulfatase A-like enzyme
VVGEVVAVLERRGMCDDTLVIFTSDNGPESRTPDEEGLTYGIRIISIAAWENCEE